MEKDSSTGWILLNKDALIFYWADKVSDELNWFYLQNGKSLGPFSKDQLVQLAFSGTIPREVLIWTSSQNQEWKPLSEVFNLKEELPPPLPSIQGIHASEALTPTSPIEIEQLPHPWRRYLARMLDNSVNGTAVWMMIGFTLGAVAPAEAQQVFVFLKKNKFADIFLTALLATFANAAFIGFTGSSIGKLFFGVRVLDQSDRAIGYGLALKREFLVWLYGLGCGIPLVNIAAALYQRSELDRNKVTSWDKNLSLKIVYRPSGAMQYTLSIIGFVLFVAVYAVLAKM